MASLFKSNLGEQVDFDFFETPRNTEDDYPDKQKTDSKIYYKPPPTEKHGDARKKSRQYSSSESSDSEVLSEIETESNKSDSSRDSSPRSDKRNNKNGKGNSNGRTKSKSDTDDYSTSSSAYSDDSSDDESNIIEQGRQIKKESKNNRPNDMARQSKSKEAWGSGIARVDIIKKSDSGDEKGSHTEKGQKRRFSSNGKSGSESEMTDVSPLPSPKEMENGQVQYSDTQVQNDSGEVKLESKKLDLSILMEAVSEIDRQQRLKSNTRRVMFEPPKQQITDKSNYLKNHRAKLIEKENKRLLEQIMKHIDPNKQRKKAVNKDHPSFVQRVTPSAINRQREQRRIEMENMAFLQRLQHTRPTRGLARTEQLQDYQKTLLHGVPIAAMDTTYSQSNRTLKSAMGSTGRRSRPSSAKSNASSIRSRPGSAKSTASVMSRASSIKSTTRSADSRPAWNDRFAYS